MAPHKQSATTEQGFALLITLIVVGVVLSVGLSILDLSVKQVRLSGTAKESEIAFHAANAGMECARYVRQKNADDMELGNTLSTISCFSQNATNYSDSVILSNSDGDVFKYQYDITWGTNLDRCTKVYTLVTAAAVVGAGVTITGVSDLIPGYPPDVDGNDNHYCEPGARCTIISVRGYNKSCGVVNPPGGAYGIVEREVLLQF